MPRAPFPDEFGIADNCNPATVDYFIEIFGYQEALELGAIDDPTRNTLNVDKIQVALNDAATLINNYIITAPPQGKILIAGSYRRTQATIARWYLDTLRPRQQVIEAAEKALEQLELWAAKSSPSSGLKWQEAYRYWKNGCTMTRSVYNRGRSFTEPSTSRWVLREGGNNRFWQLPRREARSASREASEKLSASTQAGGLETTMPESTLLVNELFDALETTRDLSSFTNTSETVDASHGDMIIASNESESESGEFDNSSGLIEGDTF